MVSTEENSLEYALPESAKAYEQAFAAFAGAKWLGAPQYRQSPEVRAEAEALSGRLGIEARITQQDIDTIGAEVTQRCMVAGVPPSEIARLIARLASNVGASKSSLDDIRGEALKEANALANEANGKVSDGSETKAQKIERMWGEIEALNRKTLEGVDALHDNDLISEDEANKWKDELNEIMAMPNGEEKARRLQDFNQRYGDRLQQILDSLQPDDPRRELVSGLIAKEKKKDGVLADNIESLQQIRSPSTTRMQMGEDNNLGLSATDVPAAAQRPEKHNTIISTISAAQNVSPADSGRLTPTDVTRVAVAAQGPSFNL